MKKVNNLIELIKVHKAPQIMNIDTDMPLFKIVLGISDGKIIQYVFEAIGEIAEGGTAKIEFKQALVFDTYQEYDQYIKAQKGPTICPNPDLLSPSDSGA